MTLTALLCIILNDLSSLCDKYFLISVSVLPNKYQTHFTVEPNTGVISVTTALDREEIDQITVYIQVIILSFFSLPTEKIFVF